MTRPGQFFEDNSLAGYDHAADTAFRLYADLRNADTSNPHDRLRAIQGLTTWLHKLQNKTQHQHPETLQPNPYQPH
jgi:hypothetical protein